MIGMITLKNIDTLYAQPRKVVHALKNISLKIDKGEIFGILGHKGAGKTTLLRCINLLERPTHGTVMVDNCNLSLMTHEALRAARQKIGMIFQETHLIESRTVFHNIALALELSHATHSEIQTQVQGLLALTGLTDYAHIYPEQLSHGQKQRVAIARALANNPTLLLCDEITAGLDPKTAHSLLQLLNHLNKKRGLTIVCVTRDCDVIKSICHRVGVLEEGILVEQNTVNEFFAQPISQAAQEWVKSATRHDLPMALKRRLRAQPGTNTYPVLRIVFRDLAVGDIINDTTPERVLARMIRDYQVKINILQAHLESIQNNKLGSMVIDLIGLPENIQNAMAFLTGNHLHIEVLGHAPLTT